jgi:release factor glutamine methyltransferase
MPERIGDLLREAARRLGVLPQAEPRLEAELLLSEATGLTRTRLLGWPEQVLSPKQRGRFDALLGRRLAGEPIAYIRGRQAFWTLELKVTPDTLIPRPETELLVETALARLPAEQRLRIADAGTGSGAIAAALAGERPAWLLIAIERGAGAARVAAENLRRWAPENARVVRADWLAPVARAGLNAVVSNPPYIPEADPHLGRGDLVHEPRAALAAGPDGLAAIRRLTEQAAVCLRPGGLLLLEHGFDQGAAVRAILAAQGFRGIVTRTDLAGLPRATLGRR